METIEQLKKNPDYLFKCNITANDYKIMTSCDVWDAAYIRCGSKGVDIISAWTMDVITLQFICQKKHTMENIL